MANILTFCVHEDASIFDDLLTALKSHGHNVTDLGLSSLDEVDFSNAMPHYIDSCDVAMPLIDSESLRSYHFRKELSFAFTFMREQKRSDAIVPIVVEGTNFGGDLTLLSPIILEPGKANEAARIVSLRIDRIMARHAAQAISREEQRAQVKKSAATYIQSTQETLKDRETNLKHWAQTWYLISYVSLGAGVGLSIWRGVEILLPQNGFGLAAYLFTGLIIATFLIAISKLSFTLAKGYMVESLRIADRSHAIAFGEFYLNAFEEKIEWSEVKDVFQHWNIDRGSSFISQEASQFDPKLLETALEIAKILKAQEKA